MPNYKCLLCGNEFFRWNSRIPKTPKFCSRECYRSSPWEWTNRKNKTDEEKEEKLRKHFEKLVIKKEDCWDWKGSQTSFGYGKSLGYFKLWTAPRVSWFLNYGPIPKYKCILHSCDNPICSNPEHLFLGEKKENNNDRHKKLRDAKGSNNGNSKLDEKKVKQIKNMLKKGISQVMIGKKFGVHQAQISAIKLGKTWRHVIC